MTIQTYVWCQLSGIEFLSKIIQMRSKVSEKLSLTRTIDGNSILQFFSYFGQIVSRNIVFLSKFFEKREKLLKIDIKLTNSSWIHNLLFNFLLYFSFLGHRFVKRLNKWSSSHYISNLFSEAIKSHFVFKWSDIAEEQIPIKTWYISWIITF